MARTPSTSSGRSTYATRIQAFLDQYPEAAPAYHVHRALTGYGPVGVTLQRWEKAQGPCEACGHAVKQRFGIQTRDGLKWIGADCNDVIYRHAQKADRLTREEHL